MTAQPSRANPVLIAFAISAAVDGVAATAGFADQLPPSAVFWIVALNVALKLGLGVYVRGVVVPLGNVAVRRTDDGQLYAEKGIEQVDQPAARMRSSYHNDTGIGFNAEMTPPIEPGDRVSLVRDPVQPLS